MSNLVLTETEATEAADSVECGDRVPTVPEQPRLAPQRKRLPDTRQSITHKFSVSGHEGYLTVGLYEDGTPGELFIKMARQDSTMSGLVDTIAVLVSMALQFGVPADRLAEKFQNTRFEPSGHTTNREIPLASSISDYVFTWLGLHFSESFRTAHAARRLDEH